MNPPRRLHLFLFLAALMPSLENVHGDEQVSFRVKPECSVTENTTSVHLLFHSKPGEKKRTHLVTLSCSAGKCDGIFLDLSSGESSFMNTNTMAIEKGAVYNGSYTYNWGRYRAITLDFVKHLAFFEYHDEKDRYELVAKCE